MSDETSDLEYEAAVVIDNGSGVCKIGIAGMDAPTNTFPAVIGVTAEGEEIDGKTIFVGEEAEEFRDDLTLSYPIEHGIVNDWDNMERIWEHCFELLADDNEDFSPDVQPVLLTEAPRNPKKNREHMVEFMFDTFDVPAVYVALQAILALYASGKVTGTVLDAGDGVSHVVPVAEGYTMPYAIERLDVAGRDVTDYLGKLLRTTTGRDLRTTAELEAVREIKEEFCYVSGHYLDSLALAEELNELSKEEDTYELPDGTSINIGRERFMAPEILFDPTLIGREGATSLGYPALVHKVIEACGIDLRRELSSHILLSGGSTMFPGLEARLQKDLTKMSTVPVRITAPPERQYSVWIGGAISAALSSQVWMSAADYEEEGAQYIHRITADGLSTT